MTYSLWADLLSYPADNPLTTTARAVRRALSTSDDILYDEDLQLALFCLYELHYGGINGVDDRWEWEPSLLEIRREMETAFEARLRRGVTEQYGSWEQMPRSAQEVADRLFEMAGSGSGPSVSDFVGRTADLEQAREFLVHKSVYQLKEADPHTWAIPRLTGRPKSALVEIQADEYGGGRPGRMHAELFAGTMAGLGLDPRFGAYVDWAPALSLASVNLMSLFGLHRRLRGAIAGHLALYEMTSSLPNASYARGFRRLGFASPVTDYFDEHVEADAVHEQIAGRDLAGALVEQESLLADDVFFGAASACLLDDLLGRWQLESWQSGRSSLLRPVPVAASLPDPGTVLETEPETEPEALLA
ncbi:iron-containing redox enzyme family protein [Citricoccus sp. GCM10030269]|uniref:iron-containing redox enzyme family protein n=1 Tax=Citricoccus sp. GCM10030269 TaxID=3273388 RepID=UPI00361918DB